MARPLLKSIEYYPMDTDFLSNIKIRRILRACGASSIAVIIHLLGNIYGDEGYYMDWNEDVAFLISDSLGIKEGVVAEIVNKALQVDFFSQQMFDDYNVLTSTGIQKRYFKATEKRKKEGLKAELLMINVEVTGVNDAETGVTESVTQDNVPVSTQSKGKKRKEKESRVEERKGKAELRIRNLLSVPKDQPLPFLETLTETETTKIAEELSKSRWLREKLYISRPLADSFKADILSGKFRDFTSKEKKTGEADKRIADRYTPDELDAMAERKRDEFIHGSSGQHSGASV
ncbi:DUF4373 domain-containing protein [Peptoniphilus sp. HCN-40583]|uniref:DUF4373 domain-containing protein n=1 Tax=Peptoniphilus sp. HCN-40583 TaxID=3134662 RepID=UPI0030C46E5D